MASTDVISGRLSWLKPAILVACSIETPLLLDRVAATNNRARTEDFSGSTKNFWFRFRNFQF